ncbi:MAG: DegT/DnrJ/EryC1/StrS family aminotransferase [Candidatus Delongbacteria bacterium]
MEIPFLDLKANYLSIRDEIDRAIASVIESSSFIRGNELEYFEENWAGMCSAEYCAGTASGTSSLELILRSLDIGEGDEVICPAHTFIATSESIINCNAKPVFVDCNEQTGLIDPVGVRKAVNSKTKAVIIVDLYGQPADYDSIISAVDNSNITVIQDAAQSHLAEYKKKVTGSYSFVTSFSFYPGKNLGAFGDAGAVVTNNKELFEKIKTTSDHGRMSKYEHLRKGTNARMDNLQAAVLNVKMKYLSDWNKARRKIVKKYQKELLQFVDIFDEESFANSSWHLFVIKTPYRDDLKSFLKEHGVSTGIHYPVPLHLQPVYDYLNYKRGDFFITEKICGQILSLPLYPEMRTEQIEYVIEQIKEYFR